MIPYKQTFSNFTSSYFSGKIFLMKGLYYWLFLTGTILWLSAILSYPFLVKIHSPVAPFVQLSFSFVCHQKEERCFWINDVPLPVCSRCTGIYTGFFSGVLLFPFLKKSLSFKWFYLPLSIFPIGLEISIEKIGICNENWIRFLSSIFLGFFLSYIALWSFKEN